MRFGAAGGTSYYPNNIMKIKLPTILLIVIFLNSQACWAVERRPFSDSERLSKSDFRSLNYVQSQLKIDKEDNARREKAENMRRGFYFDKSDKNVQKNILVAAKDRAADKNYIREEVNRLMKLASGAALGAPVQSQPVNNVEQQAPIEQLSQQETSVDASVITKPMPKEETIKDNIKDENILEIINDGEYIYVKSEIFAVLPYEADLKTHIYYERTYSFDEETAGYRLLTMREITDYPNTELDIVRISEFSDIEFTNGKVTGYTNNVVEKDKSTDGGQLYIEYTAKRSDIEYDREGRIFSYKETIESNTMPGLITTTVRTNIMYDGSITIYSTVQFDLLGGNVQIEMNRKTAYDKSYNKTDSSQEEVVKIKDDNREAVVILKQDDSKKPVIEYNATQAFNKEKEDNKLQDLNKIIEYIFRFIDEREMENVKNHDVGKIPFMAGLGRLDFDNSHINENYNKDNDGKKIQDMQDEAVFDLRYKGIYGIDRPQIDRLIAKRVLESFIELLNRSAVNKDVSLVDNLLQKSAASELIKKGILAIDIVTLPQKLNMEQLVAAFIRLECRLNTLKNEYETVPVDNSHVLNRVMDILSNESLSLRIKQSKEKINPEDAAMIESSVRNEAGAMDASILSALSVKIGAIVNNFNREAAEALGNGEGAAIIENGPQGNATVVISLPSVKIPKSKE